uniref:Extensin-like n=1 Tax=Cicer arietinum TaxID=3827 RepID=A0A1S3EJR6_CICAR
MAVFSHLLIAMLLCKTEYQDDKLVSDSVTYYESLPDPLSATIPLDLPKSISPSLLPLEPITYAPPEIPPVAPPIVPLETPLVDPPTVQPLQTYRRRQPPSVVHVPTPVLDTEVIPDAPSPPPSSLSDPTLDIPIAIRK